MQLEQHATTWTKTALGNSRSGWENAFSACHGFQLENQVFPSRQWCGAVCSAGHGQEIKLQTGGQKWFSPIELVRCIFAELMVRSRCNSKSNGIERNRNQNHFGNVRYHGAIEPSSSGAIGHWPFPIPHLHRHHHGRHSGSYVSWETRSGIRCTATFICLFSIAK